MKVKANFDFQDKLLKRLVKKGEVIEVKKNRAKVLCETVYNDIPFCTLVEEPKEEPKEEE